MSIEMSLSLARHYGITVSSEDAPKIILAIQTAYATGKADEREICAQVADGFIGADPIAAAIRARGQA